MVHADQTNSTVDASQIEEYLAVRDQQKTESQMRKDRELERYQSDWAARVEINGKVSGVFTDYHYYGTGDIGGSPNEESVKRLEAIITGGKAGLPEESILIFRASRMSREPRCSWAEGRCR